MAAIVFTHGCNLACPYCHNPELSGGGVCDGLTPEKFLNFLARRTNRLKGVVVTGGEPTVQVDLLDFLREIRALGFEVKLDTNGLRPQVLERLLTEKLADYVAMDLKDMPEHYADWLGPVKPGPLRRSLALLRQGNTPYELRTTVAAPWLDGGRLREMAALVGGAPWFLQVANSGRTLGKNWRPVSRELLEAWLPELQEIAPQAQIRANSSI